MTKAYSATVLGGFWPQYGATLANIGSTGYGRRRIAQMLSRKSLRAERELLNKLIGSAAGSAASKTNARIEANVELGGKRTIETETLVGRNTTAADDTELTADFTTFSSRTTLASPANLDGNPLGTR